MDIHVLTPIITTPINKEYVAPWLDKHSDKSLLVDDFVFHVKDPVTEIEEDFIVPKGYVFDWSSIPRPVWFFFPPNYSRSRYGSLPHDYIYSHLYQHYTKDFADRLFREFMIHHNAPSVVVASFYNAVKYFGRGGWSHCKKRNAHPHWTTPHEKATLLNPIESLLAYRIQEENKKTLNFLNA